MMNDKTNSSIFPKHFFWGSSTSAHQVEGGTVNQWSVWELANAKELAQTAHQRYSWLPLWDQIKKQAEEPANYVSGRGIEHYTRYKEDFALVSQLKMNSFRFGIEWARLEPKEGEWDEQAVAHYREYISELRRRGIEPFLNLWHWTMPTWFTDKGGLKKKSNRFYFDRFVQKIADEYADDLTYILTLNEPNVYVANSFLMGVWPPQEKNIFSALAVVWNLVKVQKSAYKILKAKKPGLEVGMAYQLANIQAKRPHNLFDEISTKIMRYGWNWWFLRRTRKQQDFIGINYYFTDYYTGLIKRKNPNVPLNDKGWYMEPEGLYPLLLRSWVRYKKPIFVTENGVADMNDEYRRWWLEESIVAMERAISEGVELKGYFHWSLLDNFEWSDGWWPKFGLVEVDREHGMQRKIRPSAKWFAEKIEQLQRN